jgi:hypothetical protein
MGPAMAVGPAAGHTGRHRTVIRTSPATKVHPVVSQTDFRRTAMARRGRAMAVPQAANAGIPCILVIFPATDGIGYYLMKHLTRTTANRFLTIGISPIIQPIQVVLTQASPNLFVILKPHSAAIRKGVRIPNSSTQNALIK